MMDINPQSARYFSLFIGADTPCEKMISKIVSCFRSSLRDTFKEHHSIASVFLKSVDVFSERDDTLQTLAWSERRLCADQQIESTALIPLTVQETRIGHFRLREFEAMGYRIEIKEFAQRMSRADYKEFK